MRAALVTRLKRKAIRLLADPARTRPPIAITQHGIPSAHLVDVETGNARQQRLKLLEAIAHGERAFEEGRVVTHAQARRRMARWLK
jgi:hypothetical protein